MKKSFPVMLALSASIVAVGCGRNTDDKPIASQTPSGSSTAPAADAADERDHALVRVVHAVPGASAIDVYADNTAMISSVSYGAVTPYKEVPADVDNFAIRAAGQATSPSLAENSESIASGNHYTLIAFPGAKGEDRPSLQVVTDNFAAPSNGKARLRIVNASDTEAIDITAKDVKDSLFDDVDFKETTSYEEVDPVATAIELRSADGKRVLARPVVNIEAGKSYTVVVAGRANGKPALDAFVIEDRIAAPAATN